MFKFALLDPRNIPAAQATNDAIFASGSVYGIEVTIPALASRCVVNLDPQHTGGDVSRAAIEEALNTELPFEGSILATVRPDLDAIGAMVVMKLRAEKAWCNFCHCGGNGCDDCEQTGVSGSYCRLELVAQADKFARGGWPGPKSLPSRDNPWTEGSTSLESSQDLAAIAAAVMDHKVLLADRVAMMERWLLNGEEPEQYRSIVERERFDLVNALETEQIRYGLFPFTCTMCGAGDSHQPECPGLGRNLAWVESTHRAATMVGYSLAPTVVALNPVFRLGGGEPHRKFTVCTFTGKDLDMKSVLAELSKLEPGWGGSPTIGGSPQGVSSILTIEQVVQVVEKYIR